MHLSLSKQSQVDRISSLTIVKLTNMVNIKHMGLIEEDVVNLLDAVRGK